MNDFHVINPLQCADWDSQVRSHPQASFFHQTAWAKVLVSTYGFAPFYVVCMDGGRLAGCLPLMEARSWWYGLRGVSLPFTDVCPVMESESPSARQLFAEGLRLATTRGWRHLELRMDACGAGLEPAPVLEPQYAHEIGLSGSAAEVFSRFGSSVRGAIKQAEKLGVTFEIVQTPPAMKVFYAMHCRTRRKHGLPPQPFAFFQQIQSQVISAGHGFVVLATFQAKPIAGAIFFHSGGQAIYKYAASEVAYLHLRGNNLVVWGAIQHCLSKGIQSLHLGRTSVAEDGLRRFKLAWGAREDLLRYYRYDLSKAAFVQEGERIHGWYNHVFGRLPLWMLRGLGWYLYRHLT
jgi:hypothetical protein